MKYINEKAPSVKSKVKDINKKIGKLVSKKEDAVNKAKEMADSEEPSGKMQASLAKIQLRQSESEAEKLMLQKQAEILKAKIDTAKKKEKTTANIEEMENRPITVLEGVMSDIHQMISNHKNFDSFQKEFFKEYGHKKVMKKTPEFLEWLEALYNDSQFAVAEADAKPGPDPYMRGLDDDDEEKKEDKMKKQAEMDDDDPDAYKELPGDKEAKDKGEVKTSKHVKKYHELYGDKKDESVVNEAFSKKDWDVKWKMPKDNLFNATKTTDAVNNRYNALQSLLKSKPKELKAFDADENHPAYDMTYDELMKWYNKLDESVVNEEKAEGDRGKIADAKIETALKTKAEETGVPIGLIRIVMRRGMAAWKTGHRPGASEQQWGYARVNAFLTKGDGTWGGADKDVAKEVRDGGHDKGLKEGVESEIGLSDKLGKFKHSKPSKESESPNNITCGNCSWTWLKQDGGDDMYTCHKCGTDNAPSLGESIINEEDTYNDYPAAAKKNAKKALDWRDEHGRDEVDAGTAVGWTRANQLAKGEKISADTVKRMASFNRHRKNSSIKAELKGTPWKDKGYVSWLIWGGDEGVDWAMKKSKEIDNMKESKQMKYIKPLNEAEKYITDGFKVGDKIKTNFGEWEVIETDYAPGKSFMAPFIFKGKDMERVNIPNPPRTNKKAVGYKVTDGDKYPIIGFLYQYKGNLGSKSLITKLATVGIDESVVTEKLARGLKPLLILGSILKKNAGEDTLLDLSDKFDALGDEDADNIASYLNMAIELMQDGYGKSATEKLKQFNKACKDALAGKEVGSAFESVVTEGIHAKKSKITPGDYIQTQYGYFYKRVEGKVGGQDAYVEIKKGKEGKKKTGIHDTVDFDIVDKSIALSESVTEGMSKSAIKKAIKVIDQQIEDEEGGDGEPLDNETLQALEQERERLLGMNEHKYIKPLSERAKHLSTDFSKPGNDGDIYFSKREGDAVGVRSGDKLQMIYVFQEEPKLGRIQKTDKRWENMGPASEELLIDLRGREEGKILFKFVSTLEESVVNEGKFSPMGYAKRVVDGSIKIKDAMKEAGISLGNIAKLIKKIDKSFDVDAAFLEKNVMQDDPEKFVESSKLKYIRALNEGVDNYTYNNWIKENGKIKYPKWIEEQRKEVIKQGLMQPVYDSESQNMIIWINSFGKKFFPINADSKKREKEFGKNGSEFINRFYNDLTGYSAFFWQAATICLEIIRQIEDLQVNGEPIEPSYYLAKEYFNNHGLDTKRSRIFNSATEKLAVWMKDNNIETL